MSELSGSLSDFKLDAVVRMLASGEKTGILVVQGDEIDGSLFFEAGNLTYATTRKNTEQHPDIDEERRSGPPADYEGMIASVGTRLARCLSGRFTFQAGVHPVHPVEYSFPVEQILDTMEESLHRWLAVDSALGSVDRPHVMVRSTDSDVTIELSGQEWNVLANLAVAPSVMSLTTRMTLPELEVGELLVGLKTRGLIEEGGAELVPATTSGGPNGGDALYEPRDVDDLVVDLTDRIYPDDYEESGEDEEPQSELAARWRNLRGSSREDAPQPG